MEFVLEDGEDPLENELARKVGNSEMRLEKAMLHLRVSRAKELALLHRRALPQNSRSLSKFNSVIGVTADNMRIERATEDLVATYKRLIQPEKVGRLWSLSRWSLVASILAKLRCLANVALWEVPAPAIVTSRDAKALADTGMSDASSAAAQIDSMEGEIDARLVRVASRLLSPEWSAQKVQHRLPKLSAEAWALLRLSLLNLRNVSARIELLFNESEPRVAVMEGIQHTYGAFAASLACLRQKLGDDVGEQLRGLQAPLMAAAHAACSLGVGRGSNQVSSQRLDTQHMNTKGLAKGGKPPPVVKGHVRGDPFLALHQATLLTNIASLTEVRSPRISAEPEVLARLMRGEVEETTEKTFTADDANWNIEFTASQLCRMRQAVKDGEPKVRGAQQLLADTLDCYTAVANAMSCAYSDEEVLRANPGWLTRHGSLLKLVRHLQGLWKDSGAVLAPSRIKDLFALEAVRVRHERLVQRALLKGGMDFATVVLARLALVDEMLQEPETRLLTGEVDFELLKPYQLVESIVRSLSVVATDERRRRRWLRCPHASVHSVIAGEVWRQLLQRFVTVESGFEPLSPCEDIHLSFRDFKIVLCLLEISMSEPTMRIIYEAAVDCSGGHEATVKGLRESVRRYGPTTSGDRGQAASIAAAASRALAHGFKLGAEKPPPEDPRIGSKRASKLRMGSKRSSATECAQEDESTMHGLESLPNGAPMVCQRCLDGDVPLLPYASAQALERTCCTATRGADGAPPPTKTGANADDQSGEGRGFGEDAIISWSSAVLTQNILLTKDERGIYFKWLARTVLRTTKYAAKSKPQAEGVPDNLDGTSLRGGASGRRASTKTRVSGIAEGDVAQHAPAPSPGRRKSIMLMGGFPNAEGQSVGGSENTDSQPSPKINAKALVEAEGEAEEFEEAIREISQALPETVLNVCRLDLGLTSLNAPRENRASGIGQALYSDFTDVIVKGGSSMAQRAKRAARVSKMISGLRACNVQESEVVCLARELKEVSEHSKANSGVLLVAGAARAAQSILVKLSKKVDSESNKNAGDDPSKKRAESKLAIEPDKEALEVIQNSTSHMQGCYDRCGYEQSASKVASALRFLEHDLFHGVRVRSDGASENLTSPKDLADSDETVVSLVPLLLPRETAGRLLRQSQNEWEEEEAVRIAALEEAAAKAEEAKFGYTPKRKVGRTPALQLQPTVRVKSIDAQVSVSSCGSSPREPRPVSPASGSSGSPRPRSQRDSHRSRDSGSRRYSGAGGAGQAQQAPAVNISPTNVASIRKFFGADDDGRVGSSIVGGNFPAIAMPPGPATWAPASEEVPYWPPELWPVEVLQIFHSVQQGRHRMRGVVTESGFFTAQRKRQLADKRLAITMMDPRNTTGLSKSRSETETFLPRVWQPSATDRETRYKKANCASRAVSGKWTGSQKAGSPPEKIVRRLASKSSVADSEPGGQSIRRCGSSPALM